MVLKLTGMVLKLTGMVLKLTGMVLKLTGTVLKLTGTVLKLNGVVLKLTGVVLKLTGVVLSFVRAVLKLTVAPVRRPGALQSRGNARTPFRSFDLPVISSPLGGFAAWRLSSPSAAPPPLAAESSALSAGRGGRLSGWVPARRSG